MKHIAKCSTYNGCLLAYRSEDILLDHDAPLVCPECEKVLSLLREPPSGKNSKPLLFSALGLIAAGAVLIPLLGKKPAPIEADSQPAELQRSLQAETPLSSQELRAPQTPTEQPPPAPRFPAAPVPPPESTPPPTPAPVVALAAPTAAPSAAPTAAPETPTAPAAPVEPPASTPPVSEPVPDEPPAKPAQPAVLEPRDAVTEKYRAILLEKAEKLQGTTLEARESLIASLDATRKVSKLATVPIQFGTQRLPAWALALLTPATDSPKVRGLLEKSPGPVFAVLGYADSSGDTSKNAAASKLRCDLVAAALREKLPPKTPVYAIPMGSSHLPAPGSPDGNRVAEVWIVFP